MYDDTISPSSNSGVGKSLTNLYDLPLQLDSVFDPHYVPHIKYFELKDLINQLSPNT